MKKISLIIIALFLIQVNVLTQPCLPEGITFITQAQIDSFQYDYLGCTEIEGNVEIFGNDITNLDSLSVLTSIGGSLAVYGNPLLNNLLGLENIETIGGILYIGSNPLLISLSGLENISSVSGYLSIIGNNSLINLVGLNNVTSIGGWLGIYGNYNLLSLTGLENLTTIGVGLMICENYTLLSLQGLENLTAIGGPIEIWNNAALINLSALNTLISIDGHLWIEGNETLPSLAGIKIVWTTIENLYIYNNPSLSTCHVNSICDFLYNGGYAEIYDNASGCNNQLEIEDICDDVSINEIIVLNTILISPNPAESVTSIVYTLHKPSSATLKILDLSGREIVTLVNEFQQHGEHKVVFNLNALPAGIYFCVLRTNERILTNKIVKL